MSERCVCGHMGPEHLQPGPFSRNRPCDKCKCQNYRPDSARQGPPNPKPGRERGEQ